MNVAAEADRPRRMLVGVDGSTSACGAIRVAAWTARLWLADLELVHVVAPGVFGGVRQDVLAEAATVAREFLPDGAVRQLRRTGPVAGALADLCEPNGLLFVGSCGHRGLTDAVLGSVALQTIAKAAGPIVVVRPGAAQTVGGGVVAAVADIERDAAVLDLAFREAAVRRTRLTVVHGAARHLGLLRPMHLAGRSTTPARDRPGLAGLDLWRERYDGVEVILDDNAEDAARAALHATVGAGLVVVGSHGHGARSGWLRSATGQAILHGAHCPVMIAPPSWRQPPDLR